MNTSSCYLITSNDLITLADLISTNAVNDSAGMIVTEISTIFSEDSIKLLVVNSLILLNSVVHLITYYCRKTTRSKTKSAEKKASMILDKMNEIKLKSRQIPDIDIP